MWSAWPALGDAGRAFLAEGLPARGAVSPGDHLQSAYRLWLPGHQLEHGRAPWLDPYSFQPEAEPRVNFAAWPFGLVFWPLQRTLGTVRAWNAFVLLGYAAAALLAFLWLRRLQFGGPAAAAGGAAFALAPYLAAQSAAGHLVAWSALLLPLALWSWESGWTLLAGGALASVPLSGQEHLALGAIPFFLLYALLGRDGRSRRVHAVAVTGVAIAAGLLVYALSIRGTVGAGGRAFAQVERYSAEWADFLAREPRHGLESFVFLGWVAPVLAAAGLAALVMERRGKLAIVLAIGAVVPVLLALGGNLPGYEALWERLPGLRHTRVPERLMPIAALCLAGLVASVAGRLRRPLAPFLVVAVLFLDLRVDVYRASVADEENDAYAALSDAPGRLLELPVFLPDQQDGSIYLYYAMQEPRERPAGYSTAAPPTADALARRLMVCSPRVGGLGVQAVALHGALYRSPRCRAVAQAALRREGFRRVAHDGAVTMYLR